MNTIAEKLIEKSVAVEDLMFQININDLKEELDRFEVNYSVINDKFLNITKFKTKERQVGFDIRTSSDFEKLRKSQELYLRKGNQPYYMRLPNGSFVAKGTKIWSFIYKFNVAELPYKNIILVDRSTEQLVQDQFLKIWNIQQAQKNFVNCESLVKDTMILNKQDFMELVFLQAPRTQQFVTVDNKTGKLRENKFKSLFSKRILKFGKRFE